ncbi:MAG: citrate lyase subunit alpha, partial [Clostridia bacterium]|nr:citrate lyase subunit alpha [Clostridia bacterium]
MRHSHLETLEALGLAPYVPGENPRLHRKDGVTLLERQRRSDKLVPSLEEAIRQAGLRDGMTISFHHHFRAGDYIVNMVLDTIASMGFKDLRVAASSLTDCHAPLIGHIQSGVIRSIETSGCRGALAEAVSRGLMEEPMVFRTHGGRAAAVESGALPIDLAFLGAPSCDAFGNANGYSRGAAGKSVCGSLGYALPDAQHADKVIVITDNLVPYPNTPFAISQRFVDYVVVVDSIGDPEKIMSGATRFTKNPRDLLIAEQAAAVIAQSGYCYDGFSLQTGSGGAALAVTRFLGDYMKENGLKASFALGGITAAMVQLHEAGLIERL